MKYNNMYYFTFDQRNTVSKVGEMIETDRNNYIELLGTIQRSFWAAPCDNSCIKFQDDPCQNQDFQHHMSLYFLYSMSSGDR